jgi:hypothetical protein
MGGVGTSRGATRQPGLRINQGSSWPGLTRPSTSFFVNGVKNVDARDKPGHDDELRLERAAAAYAAAALPFGCTSAV